MKVILHTRFGPPDELQLKEIGKMVLHMSHGTGYTHSANHIKIAYSDTPPLCSVRCAEWLKHYNGQKNMKIVNLVGEEFCSSIKKIRESSEKYEEVVIFSKDITTWNRILTERLGPPLVSPKEFEIEDISKEISSSKKDAALKHANSFGGISKGQTLYYGTYNLTEILIMMWPWQDKTHVTLKKVII